MQRDGNALCRATIHTDPSWARSDSERFLWFVYWHTTVHTHFKEDNTKQSQQTSDSEWTPGLQISVGNQRPDVQLQKSSPEDELYRDLLPNIIS